MATSNHEDQNASAAPAAHAVPSAPALRLRFDPPPSDGSPELDNVITNVEQLSLGIDAMLRKASASSVGANIAPNGNADDDEDDIDVIDDEPMMAIFDEEEPSDIHALDRMLASTAEQRVNTDEAREPAVIGSIARERNESHASPVNESEGEIVLEGDFEDVSTLLSSGSAGGTAIASRAATPEKSIAVAIPAPEPAAVTSSSKVALAEPIDPPAMSPIAAASHSNAVETEHADSHAASPPVLDLSLAPLQAQGIAAALAAASGSVRIAPEPPPAAVQPVVAPAPAQAAAPLNAAQPTASDQSAHESTACAAAPSAPVTTNTHAPRTSPLSSIGKSIMGVLALTNLPMRFLPVGLKPMVNMLALSLALWAPAVLALGPRMAAARQQQHDAGSASHDSGHGGDAHGSSKHADSGHGGGDSHSKTVEPKKSSSLKKKSSASSKKKSASKKSTDAKADASHGGGH